MSSLKNAKYEKNVREYQDLLDTHRVTVSQEHVISLYFGGLPTKLEMSLRMFKPATLAYAYSFTMLQEAILDAVKKKNKPSGSFNGNGFSNRGNYGNVSKPAVFPKPNTLVNAPIRKQPTGPLAVIVADCNNLVTTSECEDFQWKFDNTIFTTDVMLLPLGGCEMTARQVVQGEFHSMALSVYHVNTISFSNLEGMPVTVDGNIHAVLKNYKDVIGILVELPP
ncbi:hypothetical protein Tco_0514422 [Tanacetum coccineum]